MRGQSTGDMLSLGPDFVRNWRMNMWAKLCTLIPVALVCWMAIAALGQAAQLVGLVLYLPLDEGKGDIVEDLSGNDNNGTLMGNPKWVNGKEGSGLQFSGEENANYVEVPDHPSLNPATEITCAAWIYFDEFQPTGGVISKYIGAGSQRSYTLHMDHNNALAIASDCSSNGAYQLDVCATSAGTPADTLRAGEWQHVAVIIKAKEFVRVYVNGEMKGEADASTVEVLFDNNVPLLIGNDFEIGGAHSGQPREFTGVIDEVVIFNRALSEGELREVMNGSFMSVEPCGNLAAMWGVLKELETIP
jgi:hypothetical protein